ncbi:MAG: YraN family protein [Planctomycetota bacterium]|nr:YraN family protein [Planctomycetota bacterium]
MRWLPEWFHRRWTGAARRAFGERGERAAAKFLKRQGLRVIARQQRSRLGEIDLIALEGDRVVFVEVKTRRSDVAGRPDEAVTRTKQKRLTRLALGYLKRRGWLGKKSARFDVVAVTWPQAEKTPEIVHYRNAFEPVGVDGMFS